MKLSDMLFANAMMGEGGGGGGSSDFSTATVTIHTSLSNIYFSLYGALTDISYDTGLPITNIIAATQIDTEVVDGTSYEVVLYKGVTYLVVYDRLPTVSGDASVETLGDGHLVTITGDCAITFA